MSGEATRRRWAPMRRTLAGFVGGGGLFLVLGLYLNVATGFGPTDNLGPLLVLALIGATVGGLIAPMAASLLRRWRGRGGDTG